MRPQPAVLTLTALLALVVGGEASPLVAQAEPQPLFQAAFSFSNPGARSMGFAGAFVALADDATAAFANPAGLVQLLEPEVSLDLRLWDYSTRYTAGGRVVGLPSGFGLDDTPGLRFGESSDSLAGLSFLSFVYPREKWSLAFYRHLQGNFESFTETQGLFGGGGQCCHVRFADQRTASDWELVSYAVSAGYQLSDRLSLGASLVYFDGMLTLDAATYARDSDSPDLFFEPISYLPQRVIISQSLSIDDTDLGLTAGALWRLSPAWHLGAVYREGPDFGFGGIVVAGPESGLGVPAGTVLFSGFLTNLSFPDGYGAGFAYRSQSGRVTAAFEWDRVEYTDVTSSLGIDDQEIDDANELRLGGEYVFLESTPVVAVRLGAWHDPDHLMRGNGREPVVDAFSPPGDDEVHYTAGIGIAFETFQFDVGVDLSDFADTLSISAVFSL